MGEKTIIVLKSELYDFLIKEGFVKYKVRAKNLKAKAKRLDDCLEMFEKMSEKILSNEVYMKALKDIFYDKYISKPSDLAIKYLYPIQKQYYERGDDINIIRPVTEKDGELRIKHTEDVICDHQDEFIGIIVQQMRSLNVWIDYLFSEESNNLSMLMKLWVLRGVLNTGDINDERYDVGIRYYKTRSPFVEFDLDLLERCVSLVEDAIYDNDKDALPFYSLFYGNSFPYLYGKIIGGRKLIEETDSNGIWVKYKRGSEETEYSELYNLTSKYFGNSINRWCVSSSLERAKERLLKGDCYVYYSLDENGEYTIPRIFIGMCGNNVSEVIGADKNLNIDHSLENVLEDKLSELPYSSLQTKKLKSFKKISKIYIKYLNGEELTIDDLKFLYEIDNQILDYGCHRDERVRIILEFRNARKDLARIFGCQEKDIILNGNEFDDCFEKENYSSRNKFKYYKGTSIDSRGLPHDLNIKFPEYFSSGLTLAKKGMRGFILPKVLNGDLYFYIVNCLNHLKLSETINGDISGLYIRYMEDIIFPKFVTGNIRIDSVISFKNIVFPDTIYGSLKLNNLTTFENVKFPKYIGGYLNLEHLTCGNGLDLSNTEIVDVLYLNELNSLEGVKLPKSVGLIYIYDGFYSLEEVQAMQRKELADKMIKVLNRIK